MKDGAKSVVKPKDANDLAGPASSQPALGLLGVGSELGEEDTGQQEDVVLLDENDCTMEVVKGEKGAAPGLAEAGMKSRKRLSAASRMSRSERLRTYDELIEVSYKAVVAFPDDLDFQFEIPPEVEEFEL